MASKGKHFTIDKPANFNLQYKTNKIVTIININKNKYYNKMCNLFTHTACP